MEWFLSMMSSMGDILDSTAQESTQLENSSATGRMMMEWQCRIAILIRQNRCLIPVSRTLDQQGVPLKERCQMLELHARQKGPFRDKMITGRVEALGGVSEESRTKILDMLLLPMEEPDTEVSGDQYCEEFVASGSDTVVKRKLSIPPDRTILRGNTMPEEDVPHEVTAGKEIQSENKEPNTWRYRNTLYILTILIAAIGASYWHVFVGRPKYEWERDLTHLLLHQKSIDEEKAKIQNLIHNILESEDHIQRAPFLAALQEQGYTFETLHSMGFVQESDRSIWESCAAAEKARSEMPDMTAENGLHAFLLSLPPNTSSQNCIAVNEWLTQKSPLALSRRVVKLHEAAGLPCEDRTKQLREDMIHAIWSMCKTRGDPTQSNDVPLPGSLQDPSVALQLFTNLQNLMADRNRDRDDVSIQTDTPSKEDMASFLVIIRNELIDQAQQALQTENFAGVMQCFADIEYIGKGDPKFQEDTKASESMQKLIREIDLTNAAHGKHLENVRHVYELAQTWK